MPIHHLWGCLQPPLLGSWEIWHRGVWGTEDEAELWSQLYLPAFFPPVSVDGETEAPRTPGTFSRSSAFCSSKGSNILRYSVPWTCLESQNLMLHLSPNPVRAWEICRVRFEWGRASQPCVWAVRGYFGRESGKECFVLFAPRDYQRWWSPARLPWTPSEPQAKNWAGKEMSCYTVWQPQVTWV